MRERPPAAGTIAVTSWSQAAASPRRSLPTAATRNDAASSEIDPPRSRTSDDTQPDISHGFGGALLISWTDFNFRSLSRSPFPLLPPGCTATHATSGDGAPA